MSDQFCGSCGRPCQVDLDLCLEPIINARFACCGRLTCLAELQRGELRQVERQEGA